MNRRSFLAVGTVPAWLAASPLAPAAMIQDRRLGFQLKERAGLRRFGYPVHATLPDEAGLGEVPEAHFRLERQGRDIPAQFRRARHADGRFLVALDFNASPGPFEIEDYTVHFDGGPKPGRESERGMSVRRDGPIIAVSNSPYLTYTLADDLTGLIRSVRIPQLEFLGHGFRGLFVGWNDQITHLPTRPRDPGRPPGLEITRQGPMAIGLRYREPIALADLQPVATTVELTFPSSKSWIETNWTVEDPQNQVERIGLDLGLQLDGQPTLVDWGASSTVYGTLRGRELMTFEAGGLPSAPGVIREWVIRRGAVEKLQEFAAAERAQGNEPEGWVHVMDQKRCTAMAVADFGRLTLDVRDRFEVNASGHLLFERKFINEKSGSRVPGKPKKTLRFWLHFVTTPVQVGAVTSPQSMLAPLEVEWTAQGAPRPRRHD